MDPSTPAPRGLMSARRLLETEPCPCRSEKTYAECCRGELKDGYTVENTLHVLFEEKDSAAPDALAFYAVQTMKMNGEVPPDQIVESIAKRLWSPPLQRALDRLTWQAANSKGLKMTMTPLPEEVPVQVPGRIGTYSEEDVKRLSSKIELHDSSGNVIK